MVAPRTAKLLRLGAIACALAACGGAPRLAPSTRVAEAPPVTTESRASVTPAVPPPTLRLARAAPPWRFEDPERHTKAERLAVKLRATVTRYFEETSAVQAALGFAFVVDDRVLVADTLGSADLEAQTPATADTLFRIASVTKTFTAAAALKLRDEGRLRLDAPLEDVLPELRAAAYPHRDDAALTVEQVLTHAAGLARSGRYAAAPADARSTEADVLAAAAELATDPGIGHAYSNVGFALLGIAVGRVSGTRYRDYVTREILAPIGMTATTFDVDATASERLARGYGIGPTGRLVRAPTVANGAAEGAGGLFSTVADLARWVRFQLAAWPPRDDEDTGPVKRATLREAHRAHGATGLDLRYETDAARARPPELVTQARGVGLGWFTRQTCRFEHLVEHEGALGGYRAHLLFAPQRGFGLVLVSSSEAVPVASLTDRLLRTIARDGALEPRTLVVRRNEPPAPPEREIPTAAREIARKLAATTAKPTEAAVRSALASAGAPPAQEAGATAPAEPLPRRTRAAASGAEPSLDPKALARALAQSRLGTCELGRATPTARDVTFELRCERDDARLVLRIGDDGPLEAVRIEPIPRCAF